MPDNIFKSAYRTLRHTVGKRDDTFKIGVLQTQLDYEWNRLDDHHKANNVLLGKKRQEVVDLLGTGNADRAGLALIGLRDAITPYEKSALPGKAGEVAAAVMGRAPIIEGDGDLGLPQPELRQVGEPVLKEGWKDGVTDQQKIDRLVFGDTVERAPGKVDDGPVAYSSLSTGHDIKAISFTNSEGEKITRNVIFEMKLDGIKYEATKFLGSGSFGDVFEYADSKGNKLAVKYVEEGGAETDISMSEILMRGSKDAIGRQNVMTIKAYDTVNVNGSVKDLVIMDIADGGDLSNTKEALNAASKSGALPQEARDVLNQFMMKQALEGLCYVRDQGIHHGDLKEANIFITADGTVKIADFGGSEADKALEKKGPSPTMSPAYQDPSLEFLYGKITSEAELTKSDTYTMGLIMKMMHRGDQVIDKRIVGDRTKIELSRDDEQLTGALKDAVKAMTDAKAANRPVLEAILDSAYIKNAENYNPDTTRELMAANIAYGKAIKGIKNSDVVKLRSDIKEKRKQLVDMLKSTDAQAMRDEIKRGKRELESLEADLAVHQVHLDKIREISQRLQSGN